MEPAIHADRLTRRFGDFTAVDGLTFDVAPGEIFGFLGPNGAGKTTAIKILCGLLLPTSGAGRVAGHDIVTEAEAVKRHLGYMSQQFSLYPDLTVDENVSFFAGLYGVTGRRLEERRARALGLAGLEDQRGRPTADLPLGFKQRLALACAVLHEPAVLLLDEPTSGVDPLSRRAFWGLIDGLAARGTTVLVSTHYMEEAEYCHRIAVMNRGRLVGLGSPAEIRAATPHPLLMLETPDLLEAVAALRRHALVAEVALFGRRVHVAVTDRARALAELPGALAAAGVRMTSLAPVAPSLEDAVVALVESAGGMASG
ncbi:MAG: ATP-binding cassette domain-containing protein [Gemmatimonadota bacterium]